MGTKRNRDRQHFCFSIACLTMFLMIACAPHKQEIVAPPERAKCDHLEDVGQLISRGDFDGALKQSQEALTRSPRTLPDDEALMDLGLLSIHYANPKKDYKKAIGYFMRLEREFPQSPLAEEAKIWTSVLQAFERAKQVDLDIEKMKKGMGK